MTAASLAFELLVMISIGIFIRRRGIVGEEFASSLTNFMLTVTLPCMIVQSMNLPFSRQQMKQGGTLLLVSLVLLSLYFILGQLTYRLVGGGARGRSFRFGCIFTNFTFMGLPVVDSLYGQEGLFYFVIFIIPFRLAYYASAAPLLTPAELRPANRSALHALRGFITPPVLAAFLGLFLYVTQLPLPTLIHHILSTVGGVSTPLGMILCGLSLGGFRVKDFASPRYLALPALRNLAIPALTCALLLPLPLAPMIKQLLTVFAALPVASLLAAFTIQYDPDPASRLESGGAVFLSTLLSAVTLPLWAYLAALIFTG